MCNMPCIDPWMHCKLLNNIVFASFEELKAKAPPLRPCNGYYPNLFRRPKSWMLLNDRKLNR